MGQRALAVVAVLVVVGADAQSAPRTEPECPIADMAIEKVQEAARNAPSCDKSVEVFRLCGAGATSDIILGGIVTEKCEADFLRRLSRRERRAYANAQHRCQRKYRHETGSMYRSAEAYCVAEVARTYARRLARRKGGAR